MLSNIHEIYESLIKKHEDLLQQLDSLSGEVISFKAGPDKWSIVEVIEHLVLVEIDFFQQLSTNFGASTLDPKSRTPEKYQTVIKVMTRDIPVDVPDKRMEPQGCLTLDELLNQWLDVRKKLQRLLSETKSDNRDEPVYRHPYGGPLDIGESLNFIDVHFDNHMRQIDRILVGSNNSAT